MENKNISNNIIKAVLKLSLIALGIYIFLKLKILLVYLVLAAVISLIGRPIVIFLKTKLKFKNLLATSVTLILLVSFILGIVSLFIPLIIQQGENLSLLNLNALERNLNQLLQEISGYFNLDDSSLNNSSSFKSLVNIENLEAIPEFLNYLLMMDAPTF